MLRNNCDAMVDVLPYLVHDPDVDNDTLEHNNKIYTVDPYGFHRVGGPQPGMFGPLQRFHGGCMTEAQAVNLVMLPDNWEDNDGLNRGAPEALQNNWVQVGDSFNLIDLQVALGSNPTIPCRIFLVDLAGQQSYVRTVSSVDVTTRRIYWAAGEPVPTTAKVTEVRAEIWNAKYSWMLTIRKPAFSSGAAPASVDAVVFFNRPTAVSNEATYIGTFGRGADRQPGVAGVDDDGNNTTDDASEIGWPGSDDASTIHLVWDESVDGVDVDGNGSIDTSPYEPDNVARGSWVFDPTNGQWYRIIEVMSRTDGSANLRLDREVVGTGFMAMAPAGIVAVYPLGTK